MSAPTGPDLPCPPTRILSGVIHHRDPVRTLRAHGKKNEWDVLLRAFGRHLAGTGTSRDNFHFTEAPGMCPVATPVDLAEVRAVAYQCGLPHPGTPDDAVDVVRIVLAGSETMFFLARREQAAALERAWTQHRAGGSEPHYEDEVRVHTGNVERSTFLLVALDRVEALTRAPLP